MNTLLQEVNPVPRSATASARWVDADPFRAHLAHVSLGSGLPWPVIALHAGVSVRLADVLLHGRDGRRVRRIAPRDAAGLLSTSVESALTLRHTWVPGEPTANRLVTLMDAGVGLTALWVRFGCSPTDVESVLARPEQRVSLEFALRVQVAREAADRAALRSLTAAAA